MNSVPPVTFRFPKPGTVDPYFGGSRTFWFLHVVPNEANGFKPPVKSVVVKQPGATRGIRFILYESAKAYFQALAEEQNPTSESK